MNLNKNINQEEINKRLGLRIATYRDIKGMTQTELAQKLGYKDRSSITKIERGEVRLPMKKVEQCAQVLGISVETLSNINNDFPSIKENATAIVNEMESMQNILRILSKMDAKKLQQIEAIVKTFEE